MKSVKNEFPNPVLAAGRDDYVESCRFNTTFSEEDITIDSDNIIIPISYTLICNGLQQLIDNGSAAVIISVKSSAASYSRLFRFEKDSTDMILKIPKYSVVKRVEIAGSIIAAAAIGNFRCDGEFNDMYFGSQTFEIRKGDILAREDSRMIYIDDSELEKPISSIFNITKLSEQEEFIVPDFSDEKINICLRPELYDQYYHFKDMNGGMLRRYITGIVVYPVLVEAITKICNYYQYGSDEVSSDRRWFRAIEHKAEKYNIKLDNYFDPPTMLADKLLGNVAYEALRSLNDMLESEMNNGESQMMGGID